MAYLGFGAYLISLFMVMGLASRVVCVVVKGIERGVVRKVSFKYRSVITLTEEFSGGS